jgi:hypothetical protein
MEQSTFIERFLRAQVSVLDEEQRRFIALRYGLPQGVPLYLKRIGQEANLSRERIRQIVNRSLLIIHCTGKRQISKHETTEVCAVFISYLLERIRPEAPGHLERILSFAREELPSLPLMLALPLLVTLIYGKGDWSKSLLTDLFRVQRGVLSPEILE